MSLSFYEALLGVSVTLGLAIPVFMDKVMRPRYEERFEEFRQASRSIFIDMFEDALKRLKQTKEWINEEIVDLIESLFTQWGEIKTNETRLQNAVRYRKYLFLGWMVSAVLSAFSIKYPDLKLFRELKLGQLGEIVFLAMLIISIFYALELFSFDERLSKYRGIPREGAPSPEVPTYVSMLKLGREMEMKVETTLRDSSIKYSREPISAKDLVVMADFAVPSSKEPQYVIEVKRRIHSASLYSLYGRFERIKRAFPKVKGVLILDFSETHPRFLKHAEKILDFVVDFKRLDTLKDILKVQKE